MSQSIPAPAALKLRHTMFVHVELSPPFIVGMGKNGFRQVVPVIGGWFEGERVRGKVLSGGADWNVLRRDNVTEVRARYTLQTDDGALIDIVNNGITTALPETIGKLLRGEDPDLSEWYFRTVPEFETADEKYQWLQRSIFVGDLLAPNGSAARFHVHEVL